MPVTATWEMQHAARNSIEMPDDFYDQGFDISTEDMTLAHSAMLTAAPDPLDDAELVEKVAQAIDRSNLNWRNGFDGPLKRKARETARAAMAAMGGK